MNIAQRLALAVGILAAAVCAALILTGGTPAPAAPAPVTVTADDHGNVTGTVLSATDTTVTFRTDDGRTIETTVHPTVAAIVAPGESFSIAVRDLR